MAKSPEKEGLSPIFTMSRAELSAYWWTIRKELEKKPVEQLTEQEKNQLTLAIIYTEK